LAFQVEAKIPVLQKLGTWDGGSKWCNRLQEIVTQFSRERTDMPELPPPSLPSSYILDESDPDIVILRRSDGSFVAAFSALGYTTQAIIEAAQEDYRRLLARRLSGGEKVMLDELPEHVAIVDRSGTIVTVNQAWKRFAKDNGGDPNKVLEGANYLKVCERATGEQSGYAASFAEGLRAVLSGREERFAMEYPCHSPTERRWFVGRVLPFSEGDSPMAIVAHENITGRKVLTEH
jgi:PAS domain-containing protein